MNPENLRSFLKLSLLSLFVIMIGIIFVIMRDNLAPDDSSAIYGGKPEAGYLSAGFLASYKERNTGAYELVSCGLVYLSSNQAITAGHCIKEDNTIKVGTGNYNSDINANVEVNEAIIHPDWNEEDRSFDIAKIFFEDTENLELATVTTPATGCNYIIVGYGLSDGEDQDNTLRERKSIDLCIDAMTDKLIYISSVSGGVCFGDSGSPIFVKDTNEVVAVLSAVFISDQENNETCDYGNTALGVRLDAYADFINGNSLESQICNDSCESSLCVSGLTCTDDKLCKLPNGSCSAQEVGDFCSTDTNVNCGNALVCMNNVCREEIKIESNAQIFDTTSDGTNQSGNQMGLDRTVMIFAVSILMGLDLLFIFILRPKH